uniref:NADH-ubiquinone oxidoreductase chain 6 n=1 Tax=Eurynassa australis TaxID=2546591 RepID=A0A6H0N3S6_9CUCU|nr:NADH dehydrogenase subunit 6 [Eurynassa australis]
MTLTILLMIMLTLTLTFMFLSHPLSFGLILLLQTILIALTTGLMNYNFWFSYILFLIMVGGMLILFIYMTSVASNEMFKFSPKVLFLSAMFFIMMAPLMFMDKTIVNMSNFLCELINQNLVQENTISLSKFMNMPMNSNLIMIIVYLLISLIMVVKITNIQHGPLRQKF